MHQYGMFLELRSGLLNEAVTNQTLVVPFVIGAEAWLHSRHNTKPGALLCTAALMSTSRRQPVSPAAFARPPADRALVEG